MATPGLEIAPEHVPTPVNGDAPPEDVQVVVPTETAPEHVPSSDTEVRLEHAPDMNVAPENVAVVLQSVEPEHVPDAALDSVDIGPECVPPPEQVPGLSEEPEHVLPGVAPEHVPVTTVGLEMTPEESAEVPLLPSASVHVQPLGDREIDALDGSAEAGTVAGADHVWVEKEVIKQVLKALSPPGNPVHIQLIIC